MEIQHVLCRSTMTLMLVGLLTALPRVATAGDTAPPLSPLTRLVVGPTGDMDPMELLQPALAGLQEVARCTEETLRAEEGPEEIRVDLVISLRPDGRVSAVTVEKVEPEGAASVVGPCVEERALALRFASTDQEADWDVSIRMLLAREGAAMPQIGVGVRSAQRTQEAVATMLSGPGRTEGALGALGAATPDVYRQIDGDDLMAIGGTTSGSLLGSGGLGARSTPSAAGGRPGRVDYGAPVHDEPPQIRVEVGSLQLRGMGDHAVYTRVVRERRRTMQFCVERALQQHEVASGALSLEFVVDPQGSVLSASIRESTPELEPVEECFLGHVQRWRFPEPGGGGIVRVTMDVEVSITP